MLTIGWKPGASARPGGGAPWLAKITEGQPLAFIRGNPHPASELTMWPTLEPGHYTAGNAYAATFLVGGPSLSQPTDDRFHFVVGDEIAVAAQGRDRPASFPTPANGNGSRKQRRGRAPEPKPKPDATNEELRRALAERDAERTRADQLHGRALRADHRAVKAARAIGEAIGALDSLDISADAVASVTAHLDTALEALNGE